MFNSKKQQQIFQEKPAGKRIKFKVAFYIVTPKSSLHFECKACGEAPYIRKSKTSFNIGFIITKANIELSGKRIEKYHRNFLTTMVSKVT